MRRLMAAAMGIAKRLLANELEKRELTISHIVHGKKWEINVSGDYVRKSTLVLIKKEIGEDIEGDIAEVGVYRGEFAKCINELFPCRTLYLFDTFEGFHEKDMEIELERKLIHRDKTGHLGNTSIELAKDNLPFPEKCIFKKGHFPDTAKGLERPFVFVSIDVDLYQPTIEALQYFYPKLTKPGYIMIHDYNSSRYDGATEAVNEFKQRSNIALVPIGDVGGTAVIAK